MTDQPSPRPIAEPLQLAALEVADLARVADDLQHVIARLASAARRSEDQDWLMDAQAIDLLTKRLAGMAAYLDALARAAPPDALIDVNEAVIALTLAEQARRLAGPLPPRAPAASGELTLFGA